MGFMGPPCWLPDLGTAWRRHRIVGEHAVKVASKVGLRIGCVLMFLCLAKRNRSFRLVKCVSKRLRPRQSISVEGLAEVGEVALIRTAKRCLIRGSGRDDDGIGILQRRDER